MVGYVAQATKEGSRTLIEFPDCPGCVTFAEAGENVDEVAREALEGWLMAHLEDGDAPPKPATVKVAGNSRRVMIDPALEVALQVRWRRLELGWSQADLGRRLGVTRQQAASLENPDTNWRFSTLQRVAKELNLALSFVPVEAPVTAH